MLRWIFFGIWWTGLSVTPVLNRPLSTNWNSDITFKKVIKYFSWLKAENWNRLSDKFAFNKKNKFFRLSCWSEFTLRTQHWLQTYFLSPFPHYMISHDLEAFLFSRGSLMISPWTWLWLTLKPLGQICSLDPGLKGLRHNGPSVTMAITTSLWNAELLSIFPQWFLYADQLILFF